MARLFALALILVGAAGFSGCASQEKEEDPTRVSTMPWNRPESWEGQGPMGGMLPQTH